MVTLSHRITGQTIQRILETGSNPPNGLMDRYFRIFNNGGGISGCTDWTCVIDFRNLSFDAGTSRYAFEYGFDTGFTENDSSPFMFLFGWFCSVQWLFRMGQTDFNLAEKYVKVVADETNISLYDSSDVLIGVIAKEGKPLAYLHNAYFRALVNTSGALALSGFCEGTFSGDSFEGYYLIETDNFAASGGYCLPLSQLTNHGAISVVAHPDLNSEMDHWSINPGRAFLQFEKLNTWDTYMTVRFMDGAGTVWTTSIPATVNGQMLSGLRYIYAVRSRGAGGGGLGKQSCWLSSLTYRGTTFNLEEGFGFMKVDPGGYIMLDGEHMTVLDMPSNAESYVYKDCGNALETFSFIIDLYLRASDLNEVHASAIKLFSFADSLGAGNSSNEICVSALRTPTGWILEVVTSINGVTTDVDFRNYEKKTYGSTATLGYLSQGYTLDPVFKQSQDLGIFPNLSTSVDRRKVWLAGGFHES